MRFVTSSRLGTTKQDGKRYVSGPFFFNLLISCSSLVEMEGRRKDRKGC